MSKLVVDKIAPSTYAADKLNLGGTGDSVVILDSLNTNEIQDNGGNSIFVSNGSGTLTSKNSALSGALNLISTQTASSSSSLSFTSNFDSTYDVYIFKFVDIHPATDSVAFTFQVSTDGGSSYGVTTTSSYFRAYHTTDGGTSALGYLTGRDLAQSTDYITIGFDLGNDNDQSACGELYFFAPSSTTYVKHYYARTSLQQDSDAAFDGYVAGYINSTSATNAIDFKMSSGNIDAGLIKMYGLSKS
jgi:hypothetical protein